MGGFSFVSGYWRGGRPRPPVPDNYSRRREPEGGLLYKCKKTLDFSRKQRYNPRLPLKEAKSSREGIENRLYSSKNGAI